MFDLWVKDTEITALIAVSAVLIILPIQLMLCFRAKNLLFKLLPTGLLAVSAIAFYAIAITSKDWIAFEYIILAVFSGVLLIFSGIAWGIWTIAKFLKKGKQ